MPIASCAVSGSEKHLRVENTKKLSGQRISVYTNVHTFYCNQPRGSKHDTEVDHNLHTSE